MEQKDYRLAAIMYTDIAGFSRMMEKDEAGTLDLLKYHNDLIGGIVERHHGTIIKTIGDALLIDFKNTVEALQSAMETQDKLYEHNKETPGLPLLVRIGVHLGDIYFFENDALGEGINIAARLQSLARPGCICFSQDVYNLVLNKIEFRAEKLGKVSLKNITKEIHAYEITTPNVEFDPDRDKPRAGYKPGSYLDEEGELPVGAVASSTGPRSSLAAPPAAPAAQPAPLPPPLPTAKAAPPTIAEPANAGSAAEPANAGSAERSYTEEGSRTLLTEIRRSILQDTKAMDRRMSVDEALERYSFYGVEAEEVIAAMADQGLLVKRGREARPEGRDADRQAPPFDFIAGQDGHFDSSVIKHNIQAAVSGIVGEIERSVERNMSGPDKELYAERYRLQAERIREHVERGLEHAQRHRERQREHDERHRDHDHDEESPEDLSTDFDDYRRRLEIKTRKTRGGLIGNLTSFLAVNAGLWFMNLSFAGPSFHWAAIVSAAWGIGVVSTIVAASRAGKKLREADAMPDLSREQLADYKKLNKAKDGMAQHAATTVMVPLLLAVINYLTGPSFLWFLIPTAAMVVGFLSHLASYTVTRPRLERKLLKALGVEGGWKNIFRQGRRRREEAVGLGEYAELYREAEAAKAAISAQLRSGSAAGSGGPLDSDLEPTLEHYLGQVRLLAQSANEIDRLVESIPMSDLSKDKAELVAKREGAASESLKGEYSKSIEEIDKQERSYQELKEQSEVVRLRLGSSVNQLKQMRLDIARVQASPGTEGAEGIEGLKKRTDELSRYLEDLRVGYAESGVAGASLDPFAELERQERERLGSASEGAGKIEGPKS
jgi:class 3 adenylate cyclase